MAVIHVLILAHALNLAVQPVAPPRAEAPRAQGVAVSASVHVEIVRAARIGPEPDESGIHRAFRREGRVVMVDFD